MPALSVKFEGTPPPPLRLSYVNVILADDTALRLARLGIELEERFGGPRDIEFAIAKVSLGHSALFLTYSCRKKETLKGMCPKLRE